MDYWPNLYMLSKDTIPIDATYTIPMDNITDTEPIDNFNSLKNYNLHNEEQVQKEKSNKEQEQSLNLSKKEMHRIMEALDLSLKEIENESYESLADNTRYQEILDIYESLSVFMFAILKDKNKNEQ